MSTSAPTPDDEVYQRLRRAFDRMPVPFPATTSGVELRILKRLFTPDEARLALCLSAIPERLGVIHRRAGRSTNRQALAQSLDALAERGLIQRVPTRRATLYGRTLFVVGFYEAQVNRLTPDLQRDVEQYADEAFGAALHSTSTPQLRTVPVHQSIPITRVVGRYDDIRAVVRASAGPFAVMNCICQQGKDLLGQSCLQTHGREHCLTLGPAATSMVARGDARFITQDEMLAFLDQADRDGLVVEPQNTQNPLFICCCCGCCCGVLTTAKKLPRPADFFAANYSAVVDADACDTCGVCATRCQMDAIIYDDGPAFVQAERCIGCGLCVTTCPSEALRLIAKGDTTIPPKDTGRLYARMFRERFGTAGLVAAVGRRVVGLKT
ncbi:MAG: 4Fe-4S binding protein [Acidobacteria bacterium]|nr:4Fe-4S binding protein [Acidobacteriota bacterium]